MGTSNAFSVPFSFVLKRFKNIATDTDVRFWEGEGLFTATHSKPGQILYAEATWHGRRMYKQITNFQSCRETEYIWLIIVKCVLFVIYLKSRILDLIVLFGNGNICTSLVFSRKSTLKLMIFISRCSIYKISFEISKS